MDNETKNINTKATKSIFLFLFSFLLALSAVFYGFILLDNSFGFEFLLLHNIGLWIVFSVFGLTYSFYNLTSFSLKITILIFKKFSEKKRDTNNIFEDSAKTEIKKYKIKDFEIPKENIFLSEPRLKNTENGLKKIFTALFSHLVFLLKTTLNFIENLIISDKVLENFVKKLLSEGFYFSQIADKLKGLGYSNKKIDLIFLKLKEKINKEEFLRIRAHLAKNERIVIKVAKEKTKKEKIKKTKFIDLIRLALRIFKVKPTRTILTILGIGVSFGVILFLVSLGYGLQKQILRQISSSEAILTLDVFSPKPDVLAINDETIKNFLNMPHIEKASPVAVLNGQANLNNVSFEAVFTGVDESFKESGNLNIISGRFFKQDEPEIVITSFFAKLLNKKPEEIINSSVAITFFIPSKDNPDQTEAVKEQKNFKIVGISDDETNNFIYTPFSVLQKFNLHSYGSVKIKVGGSAYLEEVRSKILEEGYSASTISDTIEQANKIFSALQIVLALFGIAALVVAVIGMINTMTIALLERIQEIGIMKVIGASDKDIEKLFLLESLVIGFLGGVSGLALGFVSSQLFNVGLNILAKTLGGAKINLFYYPTWFILSIVVFASLVGVLTGLIPARKAGKMDPLQALRYK